MKNAQNYIEKIWDKVWISTAGLLHTQGVLSFFMISFSIIVILFFRHYFIKKMTSHIYSLSKKKKIKSLSYIGFKIEFEDEAKPKGNSS